MTDIHSHVLPKTDDGAATYMESLDMLRIARSKGTKRMVCTPHFYNPRIGHVDKDRVFDIFEGLKARAAGIDVEILLGSEVFCSDLFLRELPMKNFFTINGTDYLLVEFDFHDDIDRVLFAVDIITKAGYIPIIAHPERYSFLRRDEYYVEKFLSMGALFQVNTTSLAGMHGERAFDFAAWMLDNRYVAAVASDAHDTSFRSPDIRGAYMWLYGNTGFSKTYAEELFFDNPEAIISGQKIITRW